MRRPKEGDEEEDGDQGGRAKSELEGREGSASTSAPVGAGPSP